MSDAISSNHAASSATGEDVHEQAPTKPFYELTDALLDEVVRKSTPPEYQAPGSDTVETKGKLVGGIPHTNPDPAMASLALVQPHTGQRFASGMADMHAFSGQSIFKAPNTAYAVQKAGSPSAFNQVIGVEPSGRPYNSRDLMKDGRPYNSSVNTGAIGTWALNVAKTPEGEKPFAGFLSLLRKATDNPDLQPNLDMAVGEDAEPAADGGPNNNRVIAQAMAEPGGLIDRAAPKGTTFTQADRNRIAETARQYYNSQSSIPIKTPELANLAATLENRGTLVREDGGEPVKVMEPHVADFVNRNNAMTGSYDESGKVFVKHHAPVKSGVEGGLMGTVETANGLKLGAGAYHPHLNAAGNSDAGQKMLHTLSQLNLTTVPDQRGAGGHGPLQQMQPHALGESAYEMDNRLKDLTTPETHGAIRQALAERNPDRTGYYMKQPTAYSEAKNKNIMVGAEPLLTAQDNNGDLKQYVLASSDHQLQKIRVLDAEPQAEVWHDAVENHDE